MKLAVFGHQGKVGSVLVPALEAAGHEVRGIGHGEEADLSGLDAAVDFTQAEVAAGNIPERELYRAKENLKGRVVLSMESTSTRMNRLGKSLVTDAEILSLDRVVAEIEAVEAEELAELAGVLLAPEKLSAAGIGPSEKRFLAAVERVNPELSKAA